MTVRTSHKTVTFTRLFSLSAIDEVQAAGSYTVETHLRAPISGLTGAGRIPRAMRQVCCCILLVLALPQVAAAAGAIGVPAAHLSAGTQALERPAPARGLDLGFDGAQLRLAQSQPESAQGGASLRARGDVVGPYEPPSDRGLSFGFEIQPRSRIGALARKDDVEDPGLDDQLEKLIERPVFGFRGRYRF
jgi:hypothetical protein